MPNNLEQFASGELKEWSMQPEQAVWDAVAERIRKERRRRIIFWWTSAAVFILMLGGTWILFQNEGKAEFAKQNDTKPQIEQAKDNTKQSNRHVTETQVNKTVKVPAQNLHQQEAHSSQPDQQQSVFAETKKQILVSKRKINHLQSNDPDSKAKSIPTTDHVVVVAQSTQSQKENTLVDKQTALANENATTEVISEKVEMLTKQDVVSIKPDTIPVNLIDSAKQKKNNRKQPSWYFTAQAGFSDIQPSEPFSLPVAQDMQFSGGGSPVIGAGNLSGTVVRPGDLQYRAGLSFSLGAGITILQKKQWQYSLGLQYRYASMQLVTGARVDTAFQARESRTNTATAITAFYRPGSGYTYQHQFHLLQMPLVFHVQLFRLKKWRVDAGLLPGILLGAKALHYNEGNNIFYASNQQFQRFLLNASIGMQYAIPMQKGKKLWVGPQLELGLRNMHQPALSRKAFFQTANLTFTIQ